MFFCLGEPIAHGDHVFLARQSHEVAMKDQKEMAAPMIGQTPRLTIVCRQGEVVNRLFGFQDGSSVLCAGMLWFATSGRGLRRGDSGVSVAITTGVGVMAP